MSDGFAGWFFGTIIAWVIFGIFAGLYVINPLIGPWAAERSGYAELRQAQMNRQIRVEEAEAERQAQVLFAQGERDAATLRAEAIEIMGRMAQQYPEYRQQEFIGAFAEAVRNGNIDQMIYVPTEAGIPITEAGRVPAMNGN